MTDPAARARASGFWRDTGRWIARDWSWKLVALALATALYLFIRERIRHTETLVVPLDIAPQAQVAAATIEPLAVAVTVQGSLGELQRLHGRTLRMIVRPGFVEGRAGGGWQIRRWLRSVMGDRSHVTGNAEEFRLSARNLQGADQPIRVVKIEPKTAKVTYDVRGEVELPVADPVVVGKPYRGRVLVDYTPRMVRVSGSRDQLDAMVASGVQLQTGTLDVDGRVQGFKKTVPILQPSVSRLVKIEPAEITAEVTIVTDRFTSEFTNVRVLVAGLPESGSGWACDPPAVTVRLTGRAEVVNAIQTNQVAAVVDWRDADRLATNALSVKIFLPFDLAVEAVETEPLTVTVFQAPPATNGDSSIGTPPEG